MRKILIISYNFPPVNNIGARRYGEMVSYMLKFGWEPFVLTTRNNGDLPVEIPEEHIIRVGEHYQKGLSSEAPGVKGYPKFLRPAYILYKKLNLNFQSLDKFLFNLTKFTLRKAGNIKKINPDIILASYGPATPLWLGNLLSRIIKKPWIADFRDPCSLSNYSASAIFDRYIDRLLVSSASGIITVSPSLAYFLGNFYNKKTAVVFNGFKAEEPLDRRNKEKLTKEGKKVIYYAGTLDPCRQDSVNLLIKWLANCGRNDIVFTIRSMGPMEMNAKINKLAKDLGVSNLINILGSAEDKTIEEELKEAAITMVFVELKEEKPIAAGTITGKFLKLLPLGIPILVIGRKDSDIGKILNETKAGFLVSNLEQLNMAMEKILSGTFMLQPIWEKIKKYSSENQCQNLCHFLDQIVTRS